MFPAPLPARDLDRTGHHFRALALSVGRGQAPAVFLRVIILRDVSGAGLRLSKACWYFHFSVFGP